jgi:hypothetical protein
MPSKDPRQMKTGEVAKMARKAGIQDTGHMNKEQMVQAMEKRSSGGAQPAQGTGSAQTGRNRG